MPDYDDFEAYDPLTLCVNGCIKFAYICFIGLVIFAVWASARAAQSNAPVLRSSYENDLEKIREDIDQLRIAIKMLMHEQ